MSKGYMYILKCTDGSYYTGSTKDLERRLWEHQNMLGANYTKKRLPVKLVYYEEYSKIDEAFYREKQVQGWSRKKKEALIDRKPELLPKLALAYRDLRNSGFEKIDSSVVSRTSTTDLEIEKTKVSEALEKREVSEALEETVTPTLASSTSANGKVKNLKKVVDDE